MTNKGWGGREGETHIMLSLTKLSEEVEYSESVMKLSYA